jgi:hypothetical protein
MGFVDTDGFFEHLFMFFRLLDDEGINNGI